jgi:hypothetical protein
MTGHALESAQGQHHGNNVHTREGISMHSPNDQTNIARHELAHATLAHLCGFAVDGIELGATRGHTLITYGVCPASFAAAYAQSPVRASLVVAQIVSIIRAGSFCELHAGLHGAPSTGQDLEDIEAWRDTITQMGGKEWWERIYTESLRGLQAWYRQPAAQRSLSAMAPTLARAGSLSRWAMLSLFEAGGVGSIPDPYFCPMISPARYMPGAPARAVPRRVGVQAGVDVQRFARDSNGHVRPFTRQEWVYVKKHGFAAIEPTFTDAELAAVIAYMETDVAQQEGRRLARR